MTGDYSDLAESSGAPLGAPLHQAIRSKNRRMKERSPKVYRVSLPTVFSANSLMQRRS